MVKMLSLTTAEMVDGALTHLELKEDRLERAKDNLERDGRGGATGALLAELMG